MISWLRGLLSSRADDHRAPPLARMPSVQIKPPEGFRFGSTPPSVDCLVHLDNDHPYHNARRGEKLLIFKSALSPEPLGVGEVVGRMDSDDPRANARYVRPTTPGIYFKNENGQLEWRPCQRLAFWRQNDGSLKFTQ